MKSRTLFFGWLSLLAGAHLLVFPERAGAKYIGADPPRQGCFCSCACPAPMLQERSDTTTSISRSEGNLVEFVRETGRYKATGCGAVFCPMPNLQGDFSGGLSGGFYRPPAGSTGGFYRPSQLPMPNLSGGLSGGFGRP